MERDQLKFAGTEFKQGDIIVFNEQTIGHAVSFHFAEDMRSWAVKMDEKDNSCHMGLVRFANKKEKLAFLCFTNDDFKPVSVRYTIFF